MSPKLNYPLLAVGVWLIGLCILVAFSISMADGHLMYSLDDPYIHLAVAQHILHGGYGINGTEYSAPSSSIFYPFLLALTELIGLGTWGPLIMNGLAMGGAVYLVARIVQDHVLAGERGTLRGEPSRGDFVLLTLAACLTMNCWGLVMTGMEHSLHVFLSMLVIWCFCQILHGQLRYDALLIATIVALPLIRFEGAAQSLLAILALFYLGRTRAALMASGLLSLAVLGWYVFTQLLGLPILPSSVQLKSDIASHSLTRNGQSELLRAISSTLFDSLHSPQGCMLLVGVIILVCLCLFVAQKQDEKWVASIGLMAIFSGIAHLFFGHFDWFSRYEPYVISMVTVAGLVLGRSLLAYPLVKPVIIAFLIGLTSAPYLHDTVRTPLASRNIYEQQYQMHRFAVDYWRQPVAVNDLGWVSYRNPEFVLDLWGLGSETVRRLRLADEYDAEAVQQLVDQSHVQLIMIYAGWFNGVIPASWRKVASLKTSQVTAASGSVDIYTTSSMNVPLLRERLKQFAPTLPAGSQLQWYR